MLTSESKAGAVETSRLPRRMQLGVLQRERFPVANGEDNSGTELLRTVCLRGSASFALGSSSSWTGQSQSQVQCASNSLNQEVLRSSCKMHGMKHHQVHLNVIG